MSHVARAFGVTTSHLSPKEGTIMIHRTEVVADDRPAVESEYRAQDRTVDVAMPPWSPLQFIGLIVGIGFGVLGIAAVARTGFDTSHIYTPHDLVWRFPHSPLLAVIEIGFGALAGARIGRTGRRTRLPRIFSERYSLAFGIVVLTESVPNRLNDWLAVTHRSGWLFVIAGAVVLVASLVAPVFGGVRRQRRVVQRDRVSA